MCRANVRVCGVRGFCMGPHAHVHMSLLVFGMEFVSLIFANVCVCFLSVENRSVLHVVFGSARFVVQSVFAHEAV